MAFSDDIKDQMKKSFMEEDVGNDFQSHLRWVKANLNTSPLLREIVIVSLKDLKCISNEKAHELISSNNEESVVATLFLYIISLPSEVNLDEKPEYTRFISYIMSMMQCCFETNYFVKKKKR